MAIIWITKENEQYKDWNEFLGIEGVTFQDLFKEFNEVSGCIELNIDLINTANVKRTLTAYLPKTHILNFFQTLMIRGNLRLIRIINKNAYAGYYDGYTGEWINRQIWFLEIKQVEKEKYGCEVYFNLGKRLKDEFPKLAEWEEVINESTKQRNEEKRSKVVKARWTRNENKNKKTNKVTKQVNKQTKSTFKLPEANEITKLEYFFKNLDKKSNAKFKVTVQDKLNKVLYTYEGNFNTSNQVFIKNVLNKKFTNGYTRYETNETKDLFTYKVLEK